MSDKENRTPYYALFDGEEIDGKRYEYGEEIDADAPFGILGLLAEQGRISTSKPGDATERATENDKPLDQMNRAELEATFRKEMALNEPSDEELVKAIEQQRKRAAEKAAEDKEPPAQRRTKAKPAS